MRKYEAMFILRSDLGESDRNTIFGQLKETLSKFKADVQNAAIWQEKRKMYFRLGIKGQVGKFSEGLYYLVDFAIEPQEVEKLRAALRLNENILRFMIIAKNQAN